MHVLAQHDSVHLTANIQHANATVVGHDVLATLVQQHDVNTLPLGVRHPKLTHHNYQRMQPL